MSKAKKDETLSTLVTLYDSASLEKTVLFSQFLFVLKEQGALQTFNEILSLVESDKGNALLLRKLLQTELERSPQTSEREKIERMKVGHLKSNIIEGTVPANFGENSVLMKFDNREGIKDLLGEFKTAVSRLILKKYGTYKKFAERVEMPLSSVSRFFTSDAVPNMKTLAKFKEALGVELVELEVKDPAKLKAIEKENDELVNEALLQAEQKKKS